MPFLYWSSENSGALRKHQESMSSSYVQDSSAGDNCCKGKGNICMLGIHLEAGQGVNVGAKEGQQFSGHGQPVPIFLHNNTPRNIYCSRHAISRSTNAWPKSSKMQQGSHLMCQCMSLANHSPYKGMRILHQQCPICIRMFYKMNGP